MVNGLIKNTPESFLILDDSVQNKQYSKSIEPVKKQYSGAVGGLVRGIGVVNLVHSDGKEHYPVDYRIYDLCPRRVQPDRAGRAKSEQRALADRAVPP